MTRKISFWKMAGGGNDFVVMDNRDGAFSDEEMRRVTKTVCERRKSVGADGTLFVDPSPDKERYDFRMRYLNADGGEVEMCGNGARCIAKFAEAHGIAKKEMTFLTNAGPVSASITNHGVTDTGVTGHGVKLLLSSDDEPQSATSMFTVKKHDH